MQMTDTCYDGYKPFEKKMFVIFYNPLNLEDWLLQHLPIDVTSRIKHATTCSRYALLKLITHKV